MKGLHTGAVLADMLRRQGVKHVFGVPGVQTMPLYEGIYDSQGDVVHVCMRDERGAAFAAEAYAKISRRPGVCDATVGPGTTNLPSGVGEAYNGSIPMVVLISGIPASWAGREEFGNASQAFCQLPMFSAISKRRRRVERLDMRGESVHTWDVDFTTHFVELMPDGNLLLLGNISESNDRQKEQAFMLEQYTQESKKLCDFRELNVHHQFTYRSNGNYLVIGKEGIPAEIAGRVKGGMPGTEHDGKMWGDTFAEVTQAAK